MSLADRSEYQDITTQIATGLVRLIKEAGLRPTISRTQYNQQGPDATYHCVAVGNSGLRFEVKYGFAWVHDGKAIVTGSGSENGEFIELTVSEDNKNYEKYMTAKTDIEAFLGELAGNPKKVPNHLHKPAYHIKLDGALEILDRLAMARAEARNKD